GGGLRGGKPGGNPEEGTTSETGFERKEEVPTAGEALVYKGQSGSGHPVARDPWTSSFAPLFSRGASPQFIGTGDRSDGICRFVLGGKWRNFRMLTGQSGF